MSISASIHALHETAVPERVGDRTSARLADVKELVAREMAEVEALVGAHVEKGVAPATDSARHLFASGGKRVRPTAVLLACACFGAVHGVVRDLAAAAELVHMATLLHDDVIDDSDQRRGRPTSRRIWGNAVSVLAGDLLLVEALRLASAASPRTWSELVGTLGKLVDGEVVQLRGRLAVTLAETTYFEIVRGKTASLFEWALRAGAREGGAPEAFVDDLGTFGAHLGVAFQLVDDVLDYDGDASVTGKALLADLHEGKVTLPLVLASQGDPRIEPLVAAVRRHDESSAAAAAEIATRVRASGACDGVRDRARAETHAALAALSRIPECRAREVLFEVARSMTARVM
ncbi:MAG: polyprenyl synthetase family protein [Deltaproteobacteria bacterium]|nr:polyprenyl synthetase family protein [Deltaproteobacteria bacterium]